MLPLACFTIAFGLAFGVAASHHGLAAWQAMSMSTLVFAAPSQFAALELWQAPLPLMALAGTTLAIHTRHMLMGASLYPWLAPLPRLQRFSVIFLVTDSNWALALSKYQQGERNVGILLGGGIALWAAWVLGTGAGLVFGSGIPNPERFGLDMIMLCFLLVIVIGNRPQASMVLPWFAAGSSALLAYWWLPPFLHVMMGALTGGLTAVLLARYRGMKVSA
ncbi:MULTISPECIES: AzlC family ABC transporter permease [unclassified Halomonas]|uniref:AzlC family ABC transporter permease n=1 Tax=unclassified Halomonas TaxID=2609666 RepID=UPI0020A1AB7A|nr:MULTISPECIES: AzlC family ABC transporter permease [unclassified Halomonas]MCP1314611.1 AzlC family ABC transporter permease [Halomonas sp. 707D7]MCP1325736.1 AzlC family ABC transporter permease [Halomonas sp. 707D4]